MRQSAVSSLSNVISHTPTLNFHKSIELVLMRLQLAVSSTIGKIPIDRDNMTPLWKVNHFFKKKNTIFTVLFFNCLAYTISVFLNNKIGTETI